MNPKHAANIHNFVERRYEDFCTSADQHDDHKQTLTELAESAAVVDVLKEALIEAQNALGDVLSDHNDEDAEARFHSSLGSGTVDTVNKALATIAAALKGIDE